MTSLRSGRCEAVLTRAGLYRLDDRPVRECREPAADAAGARLLVGPLGDFLLAPARSERSPVEVTVDGRPPLGGIELLAQRATIAVTPDTGHDTIRFLYTRAGPSISFALPDGATARCAYSFRPLRCETAVRCADCFRLYHQRAAWETELDRCCPVCRSTQQGANR